MQSALAVASCRGCTVLHCQPANLQKIPFSLPPLPVIRRQAVPSRTVSLRSTPPLTRSPLLWCRGWHRFSEGTACRLSEVSQCDTSGAKTPSHTHFPPHPTHQENRTLPHSPLQATSPFSSSYTSGAKSPFHTHFPPHPTHQVWNRPPQKQCVERANHRTRRTTLLLPPGGDHSGGGAQNGRFCARTGKNLQSVRRMGVFAHGLLLQ